MIFDRTLLFLGALMLGGAVLAHGMRPTHEIAAAATPGDLAAIVPRQFGSWRIDSRALPTALPSELQDMQNEIYDQMLVRTYTDEMGHRIMLTIAYGGSQSGNLQVHRPEVCYTALGFELLGQRKATLTNLPGIGPLPVMQLVTAQGARNEPVTYWIRIGDQVVRGNIEVGLARLSYGLRGYVADGLLFRVSNVTTRNEEGFELQQRFVRDMVSYLTIEQRRMLVGELAS
jgi:EpsI family protein